MFYHLLEKMFRRNMSDLRLITSIHLLANLGRVQKILKQEKCQ